MWNNQGIGKRKYGRINDYIVLRVKGSLVPAPGRNEKALNFVTTNLHQPVQLGLGFHPFGKNFDTKIMRQ